MRTILVVGAGYFGSLLIEELLGLTGHRVVAAGRREDRLRQTCSRLGGGDSSRLSWRVVDLHSAESVKSALADIDIAICAAGPFQTLPITLAQVCIERGTPYVDLSDDREFVARVRRVAECAAPSACRAPVCTGWSATPALTGALGRIGCEGMEHVSALRSQIAPGNRLPRAVGTVASLLASVGRAFTVWRDGAHFEVSGWSEPRAFQFPPPIGRRVGYLVNVPEYDIFPAAFGAARVEFRVGAELSWLNHLTSALAWSVRHGLVADAVRRAGMLRNVMALFGFLGHDWGAVGVEASGIVAGRPAMRRISIVADHDGHRLPVMPAVIMAELILQQRAEYQGLVPVDRWLTREQLHAECDRRGYRLVVENVPDEPETRR